MDVLESDYSDGVFYSEIGIFLYSCKPCYFACTYTCRFSRGPDLCPEGRQVPRHAVYRHFDKQRTPGQNQGGVPRRISMKIGILDHKQKPLKKRKKKNRTKRNIDSIVLDV